MKYDIVLLERPFGTGITKDETISLFERLCEDEAYPVEICAKQHESSAMGFIGAQAADKIEYDYSEEVYDFVASILDDMENESETCEYECNGLNIWLSR